MGENEFRRLMSGNLTKEEQEQFNALLAKVLKPESKVWKPKKSDKYFTINSCCEIELLWSAGNEFDEARYSIGNCFKTQEEAEFALEKLKVIAEMKRYIAEHDDVELDWDDEYQDKWFIYYNHSYNDIRVHYYYKYFQCLDKSLYASSLEILKDMIKEIGEDRIKKYYFGVE